MNSLFCFESPQKSKITYDRNYNYSDVFNKILRVKVKRTGPSDEQAVLLEFGRRVRQARIALHWTLESVEEHGWRSWQHLQQIETGRKNISLTTLIRLAKLLKISPEQLLTGL